MTKISAALLLSTIAMSTQAHDGGAIDAVTHAMLHLADPTTLLLLVAVVAATIGLTLYVRKSR